MQFVQCTGAILIGGQSSRMGEPKHRMMVRPGRTMFDCVVAALEPLCREVVVLGQLDGELPYRFIPDLRPGRGPLGGIEALLASGIDAQYLICPCDLPLLSTELLRRLLRPSTANATVFRDHSNLQVNPLPVRMSDGNLAQVQHAIDKGALDLRGLIAGIEADFVDIEPTDIVQLLNVNSPVEYARAVELLRRADS